MLFNRSFYRLKFVHTITLTQNCLTCFVLVGNTSGRLGGKEYFHCPPSYGKVVKLSDIHAVMNPRVSISVCICSNCFTNLSRKLSFARYRKPWPSKRSTPSRGYVCSSQNPVDASNLTRQVNKTLLTIWCEQWEFDPLEFLVNLAF